MTDLLVSYARPDEPQAKRVADALLALGYQVWRDDELPAHRAYADVIEERLKSAKANIVRLAANDPNLDNLRDDPRFSAMMKAAKERVGLSPESPFIRSAASSEPLRS